VWSENPKQDDAPPLLAVKNRYQLLPVVRAQSSDLSLYANYAEGFPAVRRAALPLHDNLWTRLAAW